MLIAKRLCPLLPDDSHPERKSPVLASPDISTAPCPTCNIEYTPLLYRFPGVTRSQHNHADSGGIYCTTQSRPQPGTATALGRSLGVVHLCTALGHITMVRADAVDLTTLYIHCAVCAVCAQVVTTGTITLASNHPELPVFTCNACLLRPTARPYTPTGWLFHATRTDLSWRRAAPPNLSRPAVESPPN